MLIYFVFLVGNRNSGRGSHRISIQPSLSRPHYSVQDVRRITPTKYHYTKGQVRFIQMSGMTIGSMIEADRRLRTYELSMRMHKRLARDAEVGRRYEEDHQGRPSQDVDNSK